MDFYYYYGLLVSVWLAASTDMTMKTEGKRSVAAAVWVVAVCQSSKTLSSKEGNAHFRTKDGLWRTAGDVIVLLVP